MRTSFHQQRPERCTNSVVLSWLPSKAGSQMLIGAWCVVVKQDMWMCIYNFPRECHGVRAWNSASLFGILNFKLLFTCQAFNFCLKSYLIKQYCSLLFIPYYSAHFSVINLYTWTALVFFMVLSTGLCFLYYRFVYCPLCSCTELTSTRGYELHTFS